MVKEFISTVQEEFTLKHVNFLTSANPVEFLGRTIKRLKNGNITMEFSQKFIDEMLKIFTVTGQVTTTGLKLHALSEDQKDQSTPSWSFQDHSPTQDQDIKNLIYLLKYVS